MCFRCILVCSAHMLRGSALHVHVHGDGHLPVHTEEAPVKRLASKFPVIHLISGFMPPLFQYPTSIIFCVHPPRITLIFEVHSRYYISEHVISLQIITTWLKALRTGKRLSLQQHGWKKPTNIGVLFSATHSPHLVPPTPLPRRLFSIQLWGDGHQSGQHVSCPAKEREAVQEEAEQRLPGGDTARDTGQR